MKYCHPINRNFVLNLYYNKDLNRKPVTNQVKNDSISFEKQRITCNSKINQYV